MGGKPTAEARKRTRKHGRQDTEARKHGNADTPGHGTRNHGNTEAQNGLGNGTRKRGNAEARSGLVNGARRHGTTEARRHGTTEARRHRSAESGKRINPFAFPGFVFLRFRVPSSSGASASRHPQVDRSCIPPRVRPAVLRRVYLNVGASGTGHVRLGWHDERRHVLRDRWARISSPPAPQTPSDLQPPPARHDPHYAETRKHGNTECTHMCFVLPHPAQRYAESRKHGSSEVP